MATLWHGRFEGEVVGCDEARREYTVRYDDGEVIDEDLRKERWEAEPPPAESSVIKTAG